MTKKRWLPSSLFALLMLTVLACALTDNFAVPGPEAPDAADEDIIIQDPPVAEDSVAADEEIIIQEPPPPAPPVLPPEPLEISFVTEDGQTRFGRYYPGGENPSDLVVLFHWARGDQEDWNWIAPWLQNRGLVGEPPLSDPLELWEDPSGFPVIDMTFGVFTFTLRGCEGGCTEFDSDGWLLDMEAAMETAMGLEGVDPQRIFTVGASIGANLAAGGCQWLQEHEGNCLGVTALSPGPYFSDPNYYENEVSNLADLGDTPIACFYGEEDSDSADTCKSASGDEFPFWGDGHGMDLFGVVGGMFITGDEEEATGMRILELYLWQPDF